MRNNTKFKQRSYTRKYFQEKKLKVEEHDFELKLEEALNSYQTANYQDALEKLKYLKINNDHFLINWYLGHTYFKLFEYDLAIESIKKSIQLKSKDTLNLNFLAELYKAINKYELAILSLEEALDLDTKNKNTLISLAEAHTDKGNFEKAEKYYLKLLECEENNYQVFYQLIKLNKKYLTKELVNKIQNNLKQSTNTEEKIYGNLILAQSENSKDEFYNEIKLLNNSHSLYLIKKKIAADQEWNYYNTLLPQFIKKFNNANCNASSQIKPIFILGMPRSGTTLVENIIASGTKEVEIGGETNAFDSVFYSKKIIKNINSNTLQTNFNFLDNDFQLLKHNLEKHYEQLMLININKNNTFTDKSITNFCYIDIIKKIFPHAKFIYCSRNPLANILGIIKSFLPHLLWSHSTEKIFEFYNIYQQKLNTEIKKKDPNFKVVNLEELTSEPKKISKDLFHFLDLEPSENLTNLQNNNIIKTSSNIQIRKSIKKHDLDYLKNYRNFFNEIGDAYKWFKS